MRDLSARFDALGDPGEAWAEFRQEASRIIHNAAYRLDEFGGTKALQSALDRAVRNANGLERAVVGLDRLDQWSALLGATHWVQELEQQLSRDVTLALSRTSLRGVKWGDNLLPPRKPRRDDARPF